MPVVVQDLDVVAEAPPAPPANGAPERPAPPPSAEDAAAAFDALRRRVEERLDRVRAH